MVKQAMREAFTYYSPDREPEIRPGPLHGKGKAWVRGTYKPPDYPSPLNVRVGDAGVKVWMVINWLRLCEDDVEALRERYGNIVEPEDVETAKWYYAKYKDAIDRRLAEEAEIA